MFRLKHAIKTGLFIGVTASSIVLITMRIMQPNKLVFILMLYLYSLVGLLTAIFVYRDYVLKPKEEIMKKKQIIKEIRDSHLSALNHLRNYERASNMLSECSLLLDHSINKINKKIIKLEEEIMNMSKR